MDIVFSKTLYKNHGNTVGFWTIEARSALHHLADLRITYAKSLDGKVVESEVPIGPKNVGRANETSPEQQAIAEAHSRVKKQLDKGYVESEAEATLPKTNALGLELPMLAKPIGKVKAEKIDWLNAYAQPKLDGHRALFKNGVLYSRGGQPIHLPHITKAIQLAGLQDLHLDGELYCHGMDLQDIGSLVKAPRDASLAIQYWLYDLVEPSKFAERHVKLAKAMGKPAFAPLSATMLVAEGHLVLNSTVKVDCEASRQALHDRYMKEGFEGSMLRQGSKGYADGNRSDQLLKCKDFDDGEWRVIGWEEGTPKILDGETYRIPVWICEVPGKGTVKATAAGPVKEKHKQFLAAKSYVGKLLTIRHFGFTPDGIPDLPVAAGWREDI